MTDEEWELIFDILHRGWHEDGDGRYFSIREMINKKDEEYLPYQAAVKKLEELSGHKL